MKRYPLLAFFILMFAISWAIWLPLALAPDFFLRLLKRPGWLAFVVVLGGFGPCFAALAVTGATEGIEGLRKLFGRLLIWRVGWMWYLVALLLPAAISLLSTALHMMFGGDAPDFSDPPIYHER